MLYTWQAGDCSAQEPYNGDFRAAMQGIKAKALVLPGKTDLYFREFDLTFIRFMAKLCQPRRIRRTKLRT